MILDNQTMCERSQGKERNNSMQQSSNGRVYPHPKTSLLVKENGDSVLFVANSYSTLVHGTV